jgi:hypothetical protein
MILVKNSFELHHLVTVRTNNYLKRDKGNRGNTEILGGSAYGLHPHVKAFYWLHHSLIYLIVYKILFIEKESERYKSLLLLH